MIKSLTNHTRTLILLALALLGFGVQGQDVKMFGLKGPVSSLTVTYTECENVWQTAYSFDEQGNLVTVDNLPIEVKRDHQGRIISYTNEDEDEDGEIIKIPMSLTYSETDPWQVVKTVTQVDEDQWVDNYTYDSDSRLTHHRVEGPDEEGEDLIIVHLYAYGPENDANGNWLSRTETSEDGIDPPVKQVRKIEYR